MRTAVSTGSHILWECIIIINDTRLQISKKVLLHALYPPLLFKLLGMVTFVTSSAVSVHWTSFKSTEWECSCSCRSSIIIIKNPTSSGSTCTRSTTVTDQSVLWQLMCIMVDSGKTPARYSSQTSGICVKTWPQKWSAEHLIWTFSPGSMPPDPPSICMLMHAQPVFPPSLEHLPPPLA